MLKLIRSLHRESGQSIVTIALMSMFLLAIVGLAADTGFVWMQRRNLQNAADAAALAAAQELPGPDAAAEAKAVEFAEKNVTDLASTTVTFPDRMADGRATAVKVVVHKNSASLFGVGLGFGEKDISAKATARIASFNVIKCVVPLAIQDSTYTLATTPPIPDPPPLVTLRLNVQESAGGSNTGWLVVPGSDNLGDGIRMAGSCGLNPEDVKLDEGNKVGLANLQGFVPRLQAAKLAGCYTWEDAIAESGNYWKCKPENTVQTDGTQASAVILVPVLEGDIVKQNPPPPYVIASAPGGQYKLAYFWIDGDSTYDTTKNNWPCLTIPECVIKGRFIVDVPVDLAVFDVSKCPGGKLEDCLIDFDPKATTKIVQLID